jgi:hypothetical protein
MTDITLKGMTDLEIRQLRTLLDNAPTNPFAPVIAKVLPQLPFTESDATSLGADSSRRSLAPLENRRSFQHTGSEVSQALRNVLVTRRLPHSGSL